MSGNEVTKLLTQIKEIILNSNSWDENTHKPITEAFDMAIKALEESRWIPITERKPEEDGEYLFSIRSSLGDYVMEGWVRDGEYRLYDVVAWMPLPKPYEGSERE